MDQESTISKWSSSTPLDGRNRLLSAAGPAARMYVLLAVVGIGLYFLLPSSWQNIAFVVSNLAALGAILYAWKTRRLRPTSGWLLFAAFPLVTGIGNSVYFVNDSILHIDPFPSLGDAAFLAGYVLLAAGLIRIQDARSVGRDTRALLDSAIITVGFAAASWVFFLAPVLREDTPFIERLAAVGYPVGDVLVLAVAARFFLGLRHRGPVFGWTLTTVIVMLVADTIFVVLNLLDLYVTGHPIDALILTYNLGWGAVALHRDANKLSEAPPLTRADPSRWRLPALAVASLLAPAVLLIQVTQGNFRDAAVTAAAAAVLFLLVVARMTGLVRALELVLAERRALEAELEYRAHHDQLTGLVNRRMFVELLGRVLDERPTGGAQVLFIDLDRFKTVNDTLGHGAGDTLLVATARRLSDTLHPDDVVARLGGDEFAVLLSEEPSRSADSMSAAIKDALAQPLPLQGLDLRILASIGAAQAGPDDTLETLMHRADMAMYSEKRRVDRRANRPVGSLAAHVADQRAAD